MNYLYSLVFFVSFLGYSQKNNDSLTADRFRKIVFMLASDSMKGRATGSLEEQKALSFIGAEFKLLTGKKLKTHSFPILLNDSTRLQSSNGYFLINNHAKHTVILSAHYDHIGLGGPLSMSKKSDEVHNGADDNASGVALLLELAHQLSKQKKASVNYLIVFYSGHEIGLYGSAAFLDFIQQKKKKFKTISLDVNFDMVGRLHPDLKKVKCMRSPEVDTVLQLVDPTIYGFQLNVTDEYQLKQLDTKVFVESGVPCINFTTGIHTDYHRVSDDPQYLNYSGMVSISNYIMALIPQLKTP